MKNCNFSPQASSNVEKKSSDLCFGFDDSGGGSGHFLDTVGFDDSSGGGHQALLAGTKSGDVR